ncbi:MAG TPA: hypothetical protein VE396_15985 [Xanthobacteraceae bacterium]|nr:hypothetical protein [Xanthobacteraceae bacterium]
MRGVRRLVWRESGPPKRKAEGMEFLHKAVATILSSPQLRDVLLYMTLLLIFATAWVSDQWPDFAIPAVIIAGVLLIGEAFLVYAAKRRADAKTPD